MSTRTNVRPNGVSAGFSCLPPSHPRLEHLFALVAMFTIRCTRRGFGDRDHIVRTVYTGGAGGVRLTVGLSGSGGESFVNQNFPASANHVGQNKILKKVAQQIAIDVAANIFQCAFP